MPRIRPQGFFKAKAINKALLALLPVCRDLNSARNELRWMKEHAINVSRRLGHHHGHASLLSTLVKRRCEGEPLQYILESEYFGNLEIKCRPGVLIPRPETAASVSHLASLITPTRKDKPQENQRIRILDLCTGTGCIPLLFHHQYYGHETSQLRLELVGVDVSPDALSLARENLIHQIARLASSSQADNRQRIRSLHSIGFVQADILKDDPTPEDSEEEPSNPVLPLMQALQRLNSDKAPEFDTLISNPPYISPSSFKSTTARSVRNFEPKLALVPPTTNSNSDTETGDLFYPKLIQLAEQLKVKALLFEVADMDQATRVVSKVVRTRAWTGVEIWRDDPKGRSSAEEKLSVEGQDIRVRGTGNGRSVFAYRSEALEWLNIDITARQRPLD